MGSRLKGCCVVSDWCISFLTNHIRVMQKRLMQGKFEKELSECIAEQDLREAKARRAEDVHDMQAIDNWHSSVIRCRMLDWQAAHSKYKECPWEGEIEFLDNKVKEQQDAVRILDEKESLVAAWYKDKHGLRVSFRRNNSGTMRYMRFGFYSADMEEKVCSECLKGRRDYEGHVNVALYAIRTHAELPVNVLNIINQFIPGYLEHLKQEKDRVEKAPRWS